MSRFADRRLALVAVGAVLVVAVGGAPSFADPVPGSPVGVGAIRPVFHDGFTVPVWTDAAGASVQKVDATLRHGSDTVPVTLAHDNGSWFTATPLELVADGGTMPGLGQYAIEVTATDDHGNTTTRTDAGTLDFTLTPQFESDGNHPLTFTPATVTATAHRTAASGRLVGVRPGSGVLVPLSGQQVTVAEHEPGGVTRDSLVVLTDSNGRFATTEFDQDDLADYVATASVDESDAHGTATSATTGPDVTSTAAHVTASASPTLVAAGQHYVVSGYVRAGPSASAPGVASAAVQVTSSAYQHGPQCTTHTDATGRFSCTMTAIAYYFSDYWTVTATAPFVGADNATGTVAVADESAYRSVHITLASNGTVTASGSLLALYDPNAGISQSDNRLEYSLNGRTAWTSIAHANSLYSGPTFMVKGAARVVAGFYRVHHLLSSQLAEATSPVVHLYRTDSRIVGNNATPEPIKAGHTITVTGTLQQNVKGWRPSPKQIVDLYFHVRGAKNYTYVTSGRTDSHGRIGLHAKATKDGYWELHYFGDGSHFDGYSTADYVDVR